MVITNNLKTRKIGQKLERSKNDIKEKESSQLHDIECVEFLDTLDFDDTAIDDDCINYLDETI